MQNIRLSDPIRQMFLAVAGFTVVIALLESGGLANWADRLAPGVLRTVAVPTTAALQKVVAPLDLADYRERMLDQAARLGWSDDAVRLARLTKPAVPPARSAGGAARSRAAAPLSALVSRPIAPSVPRSTVLVPLTPVEQGKPRVVALVGDSMMAVGLSATLMRQGSDNSKLRFVKVFRSGTGLARPDVFNWMDEYPAILGSENPDVVIVALGANDGQGFVVDGQVQLFGTAEWRKTYQSRVAQFLAMVESTGARVVWVGLPPMRLETYNARIAVINRIVYTVVSQDPRATWWNSAPFVGDEEGGFREFGPRKDGTMVRLRNADGIHFSDDGAGLMSSVLMKWLDPPLDSATNTLQSPPAASPNAAVPGGIAVANAHTSAPRKAVRPAGF